LNLRLAQFLATAPHWSRHAKKLRRRPNPHGFSGNRSLLLPPNLAQPLTFFSMKILLIALAALASAALFWFCKHTQYAPSALPDRQLRWGNGGGFVGKETAYTLLDNGQIFVQKTGEALAPSASAKRRAAKSAFKTAETLGLAALDFQHPGNTYKFIEIQSGSAVRRISWGDAEHPVSQGVADLYAQLNALVKKDN
jgi:hypothetical protein